MEKLSLDIMPPRINKASPICTYCLTSALLYSKDAIGSKAAFINSLGICTWVRKNSPNALDIYIPEQLSLEFQSSDAEMNETSHRQHQVPLELTQVRISYHQNPRNNVLQKLAETMEMQDILPLVNTTVVEL